MSLGVTLLVALTRKVAAALDESFDIEIVETHHRHKVDAPSGTALMLGEAAAEGRHRHLDEIASGGRDGMTGARAPGAIGFRFASRRGRCRRARGGLRGGRRAPRSRAYRHGSADLRQRVPSGRALWGLGRPPGTYDMGDVLGLE